MDYQTIDYIFYFFYFLFVAFLFFATKAILKNRFQNIKYVYLKALGVVLIIIIPLLFLVLFILTWYILKDQPF
jgi:Na+-driven multidrug efflux pump